MTGFRRDDRVRTPDGPGTVTVAHASFDPINPQDWCIVDLDAGGPPHVYGPGQLELEARQLTIHDP
jgi:hypothetical protein